MLKPTQHKGAPGWPRSPTAHYFGSLVPELTGHSTRRRAGRQQRTCRTCSASSACRPPGQPERQSAQAAVASMAEAVPPKRSAVAVATSGVASPSQWWRNLLNRKPDARSTVVASLGNASGNLRIKPTVSRALALASAIEGAAADDRPRLALGLVARWRPLQREQGSVEGVAVELDQPGLLEQSAGLDQAAGCGPCARRP